MRAATAVALILFILVPELLRVVRQGARFAGEHGRKAPFHSYRRIWTWFLPHRS